MIDKILEFIWNIVAGFIFLAFCVKLFMAFGWYITVPFTDYYSDRYFVGVQRADPESPAQRTRVNYALRIHNYYQLSPEARVGIGGDHLDVLIIEEPRMDFARASLYANRGLKNTAKQVGFRVLTFTEYRHDWIGPYFDYILKEHKKIP